MHIVLSIGFACVDAVYSVDHQPSPDEKVLAQSLLVEGGGPAANAAMTVARLGFSSSLATYLGNDALGDLHIRELLASGVDDRLIIRGSKQTPLATVFVKPDAARSVVSFKPEIDGTWFRPFAFPEHPPAVILVDGHYHQLCRNVLKRAKAQSIPILLDAGSVHSGTLDLLNWSDVVIASERFATQYANSNTPVQALERIARSFPGPVVVTCGKDGAYWRNGPESGHLPAYTIQCKSTLAAGDVFHGAFAVGLAASLEFLTNLRFASAAAALKCTRTGGRSGIPFRDEVLQFLSERDPKTAEGIRHQLANITEVNSEFGLVGMELVR